MNAMTPIIPSITTTGTLAERAMLVSLRISQWSGRRFDRKVTKEVTDGNGAAADAGNFNKMLLPKEALAEIQSVVGETRTGFFERTLPWLDDGQRIMTADAFLAHSAWQRGQKVKFDAAVEIFIAAYPNHIESARRRLGSMFNTNDYPLPTELRDKFDMCMTVMPVPQSTDFRANVADSQADTIRAEIERAVTDATRAAMHDVWSRIGELVERMATKLREYKPKRGAAKAENVFRDSLVENIKDMIGVLPGLNITGDDRLTAMVDRLKTLTHYSADQLRTRTFIREDTITAADALLALVNSYRVG